MTFQRKITGVALLLAGISSIVGSGWLFGPLYASQVAGPAAILSWIIGGLLMLVIALTFAELGSAFPVVGGMVQFAYDSYGPLVSFITGWMVWLSSVAVAPVETLALIQYAANYLPMLMVKSEGVPVLTPIGMGASAIVMFSMCALNYYGAHFFSRSSNIIAAIKLIVPTVTIIFLITADFHLANFHSTQQSGFLPYGWHGVLAALPLAGVIYSFIGSSTVLQLAAETKNPQRNIPLALIGSIIFCIVLYVLLQVAFIGAIQPQALIHGWKALAYVGDNGPFAGIMMALGLGWFVMVIYADALISPYGTGFVFTASTARVSYSLGASGFLPKGLKFLTGHGVPLRAIIFNYCVGLILFLPFPQWQKLASFITSCFVISYIIGPIAVAGLRKSKPDVHRPFHLPMVKWVALLAFYICNLLILWTGWRTVHHIMVTLLIGLTYFVISHYRKKDFWKKQWKNAWWILPYFVCMTVVSYLSSFGEGLDYLHFGWDFLAVAVVTIIIFFSALKASAHGGWWDIL